MNVNKNEVKAWIDGYWEFIQRYHRNTMPLMINQSNLARAQFHEEEGRGGYFAPESGTSEGQFLSIRGFLSVFEKTKEERWLDLAENMMEASLKYLFPTTTVPHSFSKDNLWLPHWLYNASDTFNIEQAFHHEVVNFTNGHGQLRVSRPRKIFSVRAMDANLEWENIFSKVDGQEYEVESYQVYQNERFDIYLKESYTGPLKVAYTCLSNETVERNEQYNAWPHWRKLKNGENACAIDSLFWCYDCFTLLSKYSNRNRAKWSRARDVMKEAIVYTLKVENIGDYIRMDFHNDNPFAQAGLYEWQDRNPRATYKRNRRDGGLLVQIPAGNGPVQFGNGDLNNVLQDYYSFTLRMKSNITTNINVILDTSSEYSPDTRYIATINLEQSDTSRDYKIPISAFYKGVEWLPSYGASRYYSDASEVSCSIVPDTVDGRTVPVTRTVFHVGLEEEDEYSYDGWAQMAPSLALRNPWEIPVFHYRLSGNVQLRIKDDEGWYWRCRIPRTDSWKDFHAEASDFSFHSHQNNDGDRPSRITFPLREVLFDASGGAGSEAELHLSSFGKLEHYPYGTAVRNALLEITDSRSQDLTFYYLRPTPLEEYRYVGSIATFTLDTFHNVVDAWRGTPYVGYQAPYFWLDCDEEDRLEENLRFMEDAQNEYERITGNSGFFAPVFIWDRWDSREYGEPNTFTWEGPDPNTFWGGYQYRAVETAARTWYSSPDNDQAKKITMKFLNAINDLWNSGEMQIFTTFSEDGRISSYGEEPHMVSLLMRAAYYACETCKMTGDAENQAIAVSLLEKCFVNLRKNHVTSGPLKGTWGMKDGSGQDMWYSFWGGEIMSALAMLLDESQDESCYRTCTVISPGEITDRMGNPIGSLTIGEKVKVFIPLDKLPGLLRENGIRTPRIGIEELIRIFHNMGQGFYNDNRLQLIPCYVNTTKLDVYKSIPIGNTEVVDTLYYSDTVDFPTGVNLVEMDGTYWVMIYYNANKDTGWVELASLTEGSGDELYETRIVKIDTNFYDLNWQIKGDLREGFEVKVITPKRTAINSEGDVCIQFLYNGSAHWVTESDLIESGNTGPNDYEIWTVKNGTNFHDFNWKPKGHLTEGQEVKVIVPKRTTKDSEGEQCIQILYNNIIYWVVESDLNEPKRSNGVVIAVAGEDKASGHNAFKDNIATHKNDNPLMEVRVINADEYSSADQVMQKIISLSQSIEGGIAHLRIEAHSDPNGITLKYDDQLVPGSDWDAIVFRNDAFIRFTGCNSGGTDGIKSKESIAQKVSNKTGKVVFGFVNNTSQVYENGRYFQSPIRMYSGQSVVYNFTEFTPEN